MKTTEHAGDVAAARVPSARERHVDTQRTSRFAGALMVVVMLALAAGAIALECGLYRAFDDNWLKMDASAASSALALFGANAAGPDARASGPSTAGPAR